MRISDWSSDVCSSDLRKSTDTAPRFCGKPPMRISVKARKRIGQPEMNTLDCSPMVFNGLSSWFLRENQVDDGEALIGGSDTDDQEGAWLEPGRSEEHTSELQSLMRISYAVFCLKKKKK